ncbi:MAG: hypothetical protein JWM16_3907 [Verrucomicrobiales bacterium]|nr:hypothetical protein [Verrucomicrobiales bacterium]
MPKTGWVALASLLAQVSGNSAMHHWATWKEGVVVSADKDSRKLVLQLHGTNEVFSWSKSTLQWDSEKELAKHGKPVTPEAWTQGIGIRVFAVEKNGQILAERIILQQGKEPLLTTQKPTQKNGRQD